MADSKKKVTIKSLVRPILFDWAFAVLGFTVTGIFHYAFLKPFKRPFRLDDIDIAHPHLTNIVPSWAIYVFGYGVPVFIVLCYLVAAHLWDRFRNNKNAATLPSSSSLTDDEIGVDATLLENSDIEYASRPEHAPNSISAYIFVAELHRFAIGIIFAGIFAVLITDFVKNWSGRLRPDFLDRCRFQPYNSTTAASLSGWVFEGIDGICTGSPSEVEDGRKSFFSGHASGTFAGLTYFALWIASNFGLIPFPYKLATVSSMEARSSSRPPFIGGVAYRYSLGNLLALIPLLGAAYVAISRTQQYVHHPLDAFVGSVVGIVTALLSFRAFYYVPRDEFRRLKQNAEF